MHGDQAHYDRSVSAGRRTYVVGWRPNDRSQLGSWPDRGTEVEVGEGTGRADAVDEPEPVRVCGCGRIGGASGPLLLLLIFEGGWAAVARDKLEGAG